jgi:hypothetical protein
VRRSELDELHYITPIENVPSILRRGILCKKRAKPLRPVSVAMEEIQEIRANKAVPGGRSLHDYANLYFCARNPMMYKRSARHAELCVLRVNTAALDLPDVVIADGNAASKYTAFWQSPSGLAKVDRDFVFAENWTDANQIVRWQKTAAKCAEVLVPERVPPDFIIGAYVSCREAQQALAEKGFTLPITIDAHLFFRG